jgi:futalosine hydrolase
MSRYDGSVPSNAPRPSPTRQGLLLVVATPREARGILGRFGLDDDLARTEWRATQLDGRLDLVVSGIGKANAAGAAAAMLDPERHEAVISVGVCGALPSSDLEIGDVVLAEQSLYADEGIETPDGFMDCAAMGFPLGPFEGAGVKHDLTWIKSLGQLADRRGVIATVSTCSGTDAAALRVVARTDALAEAMEGAAVAQVGARLGVQTAEIRVVSNTTGDRSAQRWDLDAALERLHAVIASLGSNG